MASPGFDIGGGFMDIKESQMGKNDNGDLVRLASILYRGVIIEFIGDCGCCSFSANVL